MHAAVVELDPLADTVRSAAQDHDPVTVARSDLALVLPGGVVVGGLGLELGGAGVHQLVGGLDAQVAPGGAHLGGLHAAGGGDLRVGVAQALGLAQQVRAELLRAQATLELDQLAHVLEEPGIHRGRLEELLQGPARAQGLVQVDQPLGVGGAQQRGKDLARRRLDALDLAARVEAEARLAGLEPAQGLLECLLEGPADGHRLAHALHLRAKRGVGAAELLEGEARDLHHRVVDGGLEAGRGLPGDVVLDLVEGVAHGELGGELGDREARRLGGQGGRARDARVHLNDHDPTGLGVDRELAVRAAGLHADLAHDADRGVAQVLVLAVGERLGRRDGHRVPGVDAHRIEVFDGAHDHDVVVLVAHDLHLELLPPEQRLLHEDLAVHREGEAARHDLLELLHVVGDAAAGAAKREGRADHARQADLGQDPAGLLGGVRDA